jgi:acetyl-CoA/propionyl-CoA/long-chain acyl-CoA carboxylase, biotin carboxylase, biotin carboxyl carrier protein
MVGRWPDGAEGMMFKKILIANRGEIAVRVARTCHDLGVEVVAVYSDVDARARHVAVADEAIPLPGVSPVETYLNVGAIIGAAHRTGAEAIHPGYGFLSERADFARAVGEAGLTWVGPPPEALLASGDKVQARRLAESVGVAPVPGTMEPVPDAGAVLEFGSRFGYPVAIKAAGGGGGRGMKIATSEEEVPAALESAIREAQAYFGSGLVYLERYLARPKHIEVQILAPAAGRAVWLGARDCSLQRRHQKLVEETPPPLFGDVVPSMGRAAVAVANACGYVNAGTVEFLVDEDAGHYFLEINARLQVEHTITEEVTGLDLVACQLRIASGETLGFDAEDVRTEAGNGNESKPARRTPGGHAIECRVNAEDPARRFLPKPGRIARYREPTGPGIRVDSGFGEGDDIPAAYDSLIAKLVAWGADREQARQRMLRALHDYVIEGIPTTITAHRVLLSLPEFLDGSYTTKTVEGGALDALMPRTVPVAADTAGRVSAAAADPRIRLWHPAIAGSIFEAVRSAEPSSDGVPTSAARSNPSSVKVEAVVAPMHGTILKLLVGEGDHVEAGDPVAVLEAMKMETQVTAPSSGIVTGLRVEPGAVVESGQEIARIG